MLVKRSLICVVFLSVFAHVNSANWKDEFAGHKKLKILVAFGHPGQSHFKFFEPLLEELTRRGHDMTVISFFPKVNNTLPNYRDIDLRESTSDVFVNVVDLKMIDDVSLLRLPIELMVLRMWGIKNCQQALNNQEVQKLLRSEDLHFDLILTEAFNSDCLLCLVEKFQAPFLALSSHELMPWTYHRFDNPTELSYRPVSFQGLSYYMNFFERMRNVMTFYFSNFVYDVAFQRPTQRIMNEECGIDNLRWVNDITKDTAAILVNTHFSFHGSRPLVPNIVEVGGLHVFKEPRKLPEDVQKFLDEAKEGVLYFNLGSMVKSSSMPKDKLQAIINVLRDLPVKVLWKWEEVDFPEKLPNVMLKNWLPQYDILHHPNVVCFLGHGGLLGVSEGVYTGVPMVLIPFYGDQFHNSATVSARGGATVLNFADLNEDNLRTVLNKVLTDPSYRQNAKALSKAYRDRPQSPLETATWWCEYIGRSKDYNYLRSAAAKLSWYQYYLLDVLAFLVVSSLIFLHLCWRLARCLISHRRVKDSKKKQH